MKPRDIFLGLIVIVIWGLNFIAIKIGLQDMPPLLLGALRFFFATFPVIFFLPRPPVAWRWLIALGLSINVGQFAFLFLGMKLGMPAGLASLVLQAQAFFTLFAAAFLLMERWRRHHLIGLMIAAGGMSVIGAQQNGSMTVLGFWLTILAAASWGLGNVIMRKATQNRPPFSMLSLVVWGGAVAIIPLALLSFFIEGPAAWQSALAKPSLQSCGAVFYLSYLATLGGYGLWGKLLARYPAGTVSPFALLVPLVGMSSSALLLHETLSLPQCLGALLVMKGLILHVFGQRWFKT